MLCRSLCRAHAHGRFRALLDRASDALVMPRPLDAGSALGVPRAQDGGGGARLTALREPPLRFAFGAFSF